VQVVVQLTRTYKVFRQFPSVEAALEAGAAAAGPAQIGGGEPLPHQPTGTL
jgi:anti-sigma B factor antagonist